MHLGRVVGTVVATRTADGLGGQKLLMVQPLDHNRRDVEDPLVAVDTTQAGPGDVVTFVTAREASLALAVDFVPVDAAIVGIVDRLDVGGSEPAVGAGPTLPAPVPPRRPPLRKGATKA